ncbi:MAG: hypothetical protein J6I56_07875 [Lachnospiraceae bacterium]|nr:hypothetical protein [Lachnospiraceae bacterium]
MRKRLFCALVLALCLILQAGCGRKEKMSDVSQLVFAKDGSLQAISIETFDREYYSEKELASVIREAVSAHGQGVKQESFSVKNGEARLKMHYASADDYARFNDTVIYYGTVAGARGAGYDLSSVMGSVSLKDSSHLLNNAALEAAADNPVIYLTEPGEIEFAQEVLFANGQVEVMEENRAWIPASVSEDEPAILILNK